MIKQLWLLLLCYVSLAGYTTIFAQEPKPITATYEDEDIRFEYPSDWVLGRVTRQNVLLGTNLAASGGPGNLQEGQLHLIVFKNLGDADTTTPTQFLEELVQRGDPNRAYSETIEAVVDDKQGASLIFIEPNREREGLIAVVALDDGCLAGLIAFAPLEGMDEFVDIVIDILATFDMGKPVEVTPEVEATPEAEDNIPQRYASEQLALSFLYPQGWTVQALQNPPVIVIVNDLELFSKAPDDYGEGDLLILIAPNTDALAQTFGYVRRPGQIARPRSVAAYFVSTGSTSGYRATGDITVSEANGKTIARTFATKDKHERLVVALEDGQGGLITVMIFAASGQIEAQTDIIEALLASLER